MMLWTILFVSLWCAHHVMGWVAVDSSRRTISTSASPTTMKAAKTETSDGPSPPITTIKLKNTGKDIEIIPRTVCIDDDWNITVWERYKPSEIVEQYWYCSISTNDQEILDPFGLVAWPGSVVAAQELKKRQDHIRNSSRVLVLGAGCGVEAQAAAMLGAKSVLATDIHPTTMQLLEHGARHAGVGHVVETQFYDIKKRDEPLPECDILVAADVLYNSRLAARIGDVCFRALQRDPNVKILVSDSQRFSDTDFVPLLSKGLRDESIRWEERYLRDFSGSGVLIDEDQTYNATVRVLAINF
mmetsp:Transcript_18598/g.27648  ORF Transcript_18598/g.27648 Transcript_18598/m.27648 type:complete len:300 (-) Transcript_18598:31-930(-)